MNKENIPAWKEPLKTMVFNDNYIIYCFLNDRKNALQAKVTKIEGLAKPIPQETKDYYRYLIEKMEFFDDEIERILKEIQA